MKGNYKLAIGMIWGLLWSLSGVASAQTAQGSQSQPPAQQPAQQPADKDKPPANSSLSLDLPAPPASAEEDAAYKAFTDAPVTGSKKKIELGEGFVQKYPNSRYLSPVYSIMVTAYLQTNQVQKMEELGDKEATLNPNDVQTLAILGQTIPRAISSSTPNPAAELAKAEKYSKRAIEIMPTFPKPANLTDAQFDSAKNVTLAMAHSGLGLVDFRRGKFSDAIPEFETAIKIDPTPDPVNMYLLGLSNQKASHFEEAVAAFNKCAAIEGGMQAQCKNNAEEAKKLASTQLSAPK
jgi:tetratricopeptide (TPR) repeat protein